MCDYWKIRWKPFGNTCVRLIQLQFGFPRSSEKGKDTTTTNNKIKKNFKLLNKKKTNKNSLFPYKIKKKSIKQKAKKGGEKC